MNVYRSASRRHLAALAAVLVPFLPAQSDPQSDPQRPAEPPPFAIGQVANVTTDDDGAPIALGPDWEARFDAEGARFVAVLGSLTPELVDLRLAATALRQGAVARPLAAEALPEVRGDRVSYRRDPDVIEHFDATLRGLAHSLVLERPLGGRGDLVVEVALGGSVAAHGKQLDDGTLWFSKGYGGVTIGALTAIDATGARCAGALRLAPQGLEWVVPATFAERCAYPLLLDPLVGTNFQVSVAASGLGAWEQDLDSDVAYDATTDRYLVVWQRWYSAGGNAAILGQRFLATGAPLGGVFTISSASTSRTPRVANCNPSNRFVVTWLQDAPLLATRVYARTVNASDGAMSSPLIVASDLPNGMRGVDIAGESSASMFAPARTWIVWGDNTGGIDGAVVLAPPSNGALSIFTTFQVAAPPGGGESTFDPTIVRAPSIADRLAVAWVREAPPWRQVFATVIDVSGAPQFAPILVSGTELFAARPSIDGGGDAELECVVAWSSEDPNGSRRARAAGLRATAQLTTTGPVWSVTPGGAPSVGWRAGKAYIAVVLADDLWLIGVDPRTCTACENGVVVDSTSGTDQRQPSVCMQAAGGTATASAGLVVWSQQRYFCLFDCGALDAPLFGRRLDAFSPSATTTNLGGGCGGGGTAVANSRPAIGNGTFAVQLQNPGSDAVLALFNWNAAQPRLACGACQWLPFGATSLFVVGGSSVTASLPLPCDASLAGVQIDTQWTVVKPGAAPCALVPDFTLSNVLRLNLH